VRKWFLVLFSAIALSANGQLSNRSFLAEPDPVTSRWGTSLTALQYLKNNEYFNHLNPGETFFGVQAQGMMHYRFDSKATLSFGMLLQQEYGDVKFISKAKPIFNIRIQKKNTQFNLGNVSPNVQHGMIEPMYNYESLLTQPVEMGIQLRHNSRRWFYDGWLEWRQKLSPENNRQEMIVFGQSGEWRVWNNAGSSFSFPFQGTIFHRGGQVSGAGLSMPITTRMNGALGAKLVFLDSILTLETYRLQSIDNSPTPLQPFSNGWASFSNVRVKVKKYHEIAFSYWFAREYTSTLGGTMFSNTNLQDVYLNQNSRQLIMVRYVFARPIIGKKLWIDVRVEPFYDMGYKKLEFSHGLYFRYISGGNLKIPRF
jgi:hypothetical protein